MSVKNAKKTLKKLWPDIRRLIYFLPRLWIYIYCLKFFSYHVITSFQEYYNYETMVVVQFEAPKEVSFPALTICGCGTQQLTCGQRERSYFDAEREAFEKYSIQEIFQNHSFQIEDFVTSCNFYSNFEMNHWMNCSSVRPIVASYHDGRKCWTFFSHLPDDQSEIVETVKPKFYSGIKIELEFKDEVYDDPISSISDIIMALHPSNMIPTLLDVEFVSVESNMLYEILFSKQSTEMLPEPYKTKCRYYPTNQMPRSRNECIYMCVMARTYQNKTGCLNYYSLVTEAMFDTTIGPANRGHLCLDHNSSNIGYLRYTMARRLCENECNRDCYEEEYKFNIDTTYVPTPDTSRYPKSSISLYLERAISENVKHTKAINFFEFIGCLGGQAHIWLGLSAVQLYDVGAKIVRHVRLLSTKLRNYYHEKKQCAKQDLSIGYIQDVY